MKLFFMLLNCEIYGNLLTGLSNLDHFLEPMRKILRKAQNEQYVCLQGLTLCSAR